MAKDSALSWYVIQSMWIPSSVDNPARRRKRDGDVVVVSYDVNAADMICVAKLFEDIMTRVAVAVRVAL